MGKGYLTGRITKVAKDLSLTTKFIASFLFIGLAPLTVIGIFSAVKVEKNMEEIAIKQLISIRESEKDHIEHFLQ